MKKTLLFVAIGAAASLTLIISGCSKKNDSTAANMKSVAGTYKLTAYTITVGGVTQDGLQTMDACQKDDNIKFNADSTYNYIDAGTQCGGGDSYDGTWVISGNYFILDGQDSATIKSFSGSQLVLSITESQGGITGTINQTLTKL
jgi:hypothetical protein